MRLLPAYPLLLALSACGGLTGWTLASNPPPAPPSAQLEAGRKIYNYRCYFCHGYSGNAQTVAASFLSPPPLDFTGAAARRLTPEHIVSVLREGKSGTAMKSFRGVISDVEMEQVAFFVVDEFVLRNAPNSETICSGVNWLASAPVKSSGGGERKLAATVWALPE